MELCFEVSLAFPLTPLAVALGEAGSPPPSFVLVSAEAIRPPSWFLAARAVPQLGVVGFNQKISLSRRRIFFGLQKVSLVLPELEVVSAEIKFEFPYWLKNLELKIWKP